MNKRMEGIETYEDLQREKARLEALIRRQKNIVRHDVDELRTEFRKEIQPVVETARMVKRITAPVEMKQNVLTKAIGTAVDLGLTAMFSRSHLLFRLVAPAILKNSFNGIVSVFKRTRKPASRRA
jgi:hypothetical protein